MKKFRNLCIVMIALVGLSFSANAQTNSGTTPAIGTEHGYWVNANVDGAGLTTGYPTNEYLWYVTKGDLDTKAPTTDVTIGKFDAADPAYVDASTAVEDLYRINLTWLAPSATSTYYLHIIETSGDGCSNHKVEIISPFSDFQLAIANVDVKDFTTDAGADFASCASDVTPKLVSSAIAYDYGTTALYYKVKATNIAAADYVFGYNIAVTNGPSVVSATYGTVSAKAYTEIGALKSDGSNNTQVVSNSALNSTIYIKVVLDNNQGDAINYASAFDGTTEHNVTVTLLSGTQDAAIAKLGTSEGNQIINARPSTSEIGSN